MSPLAVWTLRGAAAVFGVLAVASLISPSTTVGAHGLDLSRAPQAAFAELRAYYFGTWGVLAATAWKCAHGAKADLERGLITLTKNASRHGRRFTRQCLGFFEAPQIEKGRRVADRFSNGCLLYTSPSPRDS